MNVENPYSAPAAFVSDTVMEVPHEIRRKIKSAWIAGLISGSITLVFALIAISGTDVQGVDAWMILDAGLVFGLVFGIYKKSRTCAVLLLAYFVVSKIIVMIEAGRPSGLIFSLIFGYYFWQGIAGTFAYHKLKSARPVAVASQA